MNPFEKISNFQLISRLDESGTIAITTHERSWLKTMLAHPEAAHALAAETLNKLDSILNDTETIDYASSLTEKAKGLEKQVCHPLLRRFRSILLQRQGFRVTYKNKHEEIKHDILGFPYKLEYSLVKKEWYVLWYHLGSHALMSTRLQNIISMNEEALSPDRVCALLSRIEATLQARRDHVIIEVIKTYNKELSRILYAFSCFEKEVEYCDATDTYRIKLAFLVDESQYVLTKIRFLGKRVKVITNQTLQLRMYESSTKALSRYGIDTVEK